MGSSGRWRTLAGNFDRATYFYGLLVVEGFFCPYSEVGIGAELRCGHGLQEWLLVLSGLGNMGELTVLLIWFDTQLGEEPRPCSHL